MNQSGLKNEEKVSELLISGSLAIKTKNLSGVHLFEEKNREAGIIFGKLTRPKYDDNEVLKSIDTTIIELLPIEPPPLDDTVPRPIYNEVTQSVIDLTEEVTRLNEEILDLTAKVAELEIVTQSLRIELDNASINTAQAQNNAAQIGFRVESSVIDLSNAIQKATTEAIQRVSLSARIASLEEQNRQYKETLEGKDAKLAEGAKVGMDLSVKVINKGSETIPEDLAFNGRAKDDGRGSWLKGPDVELYNFTEESIEVSMTQDGTTKGTIEDIGKITLQGKERKTIKLKTIDKKVDGLKPSSGAGTSRDQAHKGTLIFKSPTSSVTLSLVIQKQRGTKFEG